MSDPNKEGIQPPASDTAKEALEQLKKEGFEVAEDPEQVIAPEDEIENDPEEDSEPEKEEEKEPSEEEKVDPEVEKEGDKKADTEPEDKPGDEDPVDRMKMVPLWKVKVEEKRLQKENEELRKELEKLNSTDHKKTEISEEEKQEAVDKYKSIQEKFGVEPELVKELRDILIGDLGIKPEDLKVIETLKQKEIEAYQETAYSKEFEQEVLPVLKQRHPEIPDDSLLALKQKLKAYAFTEQYGKVPLVEIFKAKEDSLITAPAPKKKSSENALSGKTRGADEIDFDNMTTEQFDSLSAEEKLKFSEHMARKGGKRWNA